MQRASSIADFKLLSHFERLRDRLMTDQYRDRLDRPLSYWALPTDRRLPLAFMGWPLRDVLATPFDQLHATPGVGQKKLQSLMVLLARAVNDSEQEKPQESLEASDKAVLPEVDLENINPDEVSEGVWTEWCDCVIRTGFDHVPLGRFAPSLERLPRVIWNTPLSAYTGLTLGEVRQLKTHGEKRVASVLEVFGTLYRILGNLEPQMDLTIRVVPRIVNEIEGWIDGVYERHDQPSREEIQRRFIRPLMVQLRIDAGEEIEKLALGRLGMADGDSSVRHAATKLGLTRARVYQLLADIGEMMHVRWPEGSRVVRTFVDELMATAKRPKDLQELRIAVDLFFPVRNAATATAAASPTALP